jgi:hypothetical protein
MKTIKGRNNNLNSTKMSVIRTVGFFSILLSVMISFSCGGDDGDKDPEPVPSDPKTVTITVNPASVKQEMIGFGGALTWYSNWMTSSSKKNEIADLLFTDLGADIVRF